MKTAFRTVIILSTILYIVLFAIPYYDYLWLTQDELDFLASNGAQSLLPLTPFISYVIFILWLLTNLGLFFYLNAARYLFVFMLFASIILSFLGGYAAYSAIEVTLVSILDILDGLILIVIYFTSISNEFTKAPNKALNSDAGKRRAR